MRISMKLLSTIVLITNLSFIYIRANAQHFQEPPVTDSNWIKPYKPFRIAGNLYYVGTYDLASYLIVTSGGNILINTGLAQSVPIIKSNIEALGFKFSDIKILLATHAHYDHVAGMASIKKATGAKLMINENDAQVMADGGSSDFVFGGRGSLFAPVKADRLLHEHDTVKLGDMKIIVLHHPGHTRGACSFLFDVKDEHRSYRVLIANMPTILPQTKLSGMPGYPNVGKDYGKTLDDLKKIQFDIWLSSHASQFGMLEKHKPSDGYRPEAFIDRAGYDEAIDDLQKNYLKRLQEK